MSCKWVAQRKLPLMTGFLIEINDESEKKSDITYAIRAHKKSCHKQLFLFKSA